MPSCVMLIVKLRELDIVFKLTVPISLEEMQLKGVECDCQSTDVKKTCNRLTGKGKVGTRAEEKVPDST
jgi:hypothetical protein